jgi:hypothetical protein
MSTVFVRALFLVTTILAAAPARADEATPPPAHGPEAPDGQFPSHVFRLAPHAPKRVQLGVNYGLSQPILAHGFNSAVEVRYERLVLTYSHGQGLDFTSFASPAEKAAGASVRMPWTTGGGVGVLLIDELWALADLKVHRFEIETAAEHVAYSTVTLGAEIGWRFFVWKGFNVALVARYWPNVYSTAGSGVTLHDASGKALVDPPAQQGYSGLLANVLVGWAFGL